jgi:phosphoribosyl-ATP pyrophosphohydrolase
MGSGLLPSRYCKILPRFINNESIHLNPPSIAAADTPAVMPVQQEVLQRLMQVIEQRRSADPSVSYVARLLGKGNDAILKKIGEEATEVVLAAKDGAPTHIVNETADLWFHCLVMLAHHNIGVDQVLAELSRREGLSGLDEKASRKAQDREHEEHPKP